MKIRLFWQGFLPFLMVGYTLAAEAAQGTMPNQAMPASSNARQIQVLTGKLPQAGLVLRGTLGDEQIQASLRAKADPEEGFEGNYFLFGHSQNVLLAGEMEGADVFMEESVNGTDVSGQWNGKLDGNVITGTWQSADGLVTKPFTMKIMQKSANSSGQSTGKTSETGQQ